MNRPGLPETNLESSLRADMSGAFSSEATTYRGARERLSIALICAVLVAIPFLWVTIPPITDLPQLVAQIRLLADSFGEDTSPYVVHWLHPNRLAYLPLVAGWISSSPIDAGRIAVLLIGIFWVASVHLFAAVLRRPPEAAALCCLFFLHKTTYWGFLNFLVGFPVFLLWFVVVEHARATPGWRRGCLVLAVSFLLYFAHILWLAGGLLWLAFSVVVGGNGWRKAVRLLVWTSPVVGLAGWWYSGLESAGFTSATTYGDSPLERLRVSWLEDSLLGGLHGPIERVLLCAVLVWLLLGVWQRRRELRQAFSTPLLQGAAFLFLAAFTLPVRYQNTVQLADRWIVPAVVLLILALPVPRLPRHLVVGVPLLLVMSLVVTTANVWRDFEDQELAGFGLALERLPENKRLLGLDFSRRSPRIKDFPYFNLYAYGQALKGGELNESFAELAPSLVVFRHLPKSNPWTDRLDWEPRRLQRSDLDHFDYLLAFGDAEMQAILARDERLVPVTREAPWRLWRIMARSDTRTRS